MISNIIHRKIEKATLDAKTAVCKGDLQKALYRVLKQNAGSQFNKNKILEYSCLKFAKISSNYLQQMQIAPFKFVMQLIRQLLLENYSISISYDMVILKIYINLLKLKFLQVFGEELSNHTGNKKKHYCKDETVLKVYERVQHFVKEIQGCEYFDEILKDYYSNIQIVYFKLAEHLTIVQKIFQAEAFISKAFNCITCQLKVLKDLLELEAIQQTKDQKVFALMKKKADLFTKVYYLEVVVNFYKGEDISKKELKKDLLWSKYTHVMDQYSANINRDQGLEYILQLLAPVMPVIRDQICDNFSDVYTFKDTVKEKSNRTSSRINITISSTTNHPTQNFMTKVKRSGSTQVILKKNLIKAPESRQSFFVGLNRRNSQIQECLAFITENFTKLSTIELITPKKYNQVSQDCQVLSEQSFGDSADISMERSQKKNMGINITPQNNLIRAIPQALHQIIQKKRKQAANARNFIGNKIYGRQSFNILQRQIQKDKLKKGQQEQIKQNKQLKITKLELKTNGRMTLIQRYKTQQKEFYHKLNPFDYSKDKKTKQKSLSKLAMPLNKVRPNTVDILIPAITKIQNKKSKTISQASMPFSKKIIQGFYAANNNNTQQNGQQASYLKIATRKKNKLKNLSSLNEHVMLFKAPSSKKIIESNAKFSNAQSSSRKLQLNNVNNSKHNLLPKQTLIEKRKRRARGLRLLIKISFKYSILKIHFQRIMLSQKSIPIYAKLRQNMFVLSVANQYFEWLVPTKYLKVGQSLSSFIQKRRSWNPNIKKKLKNYGLINIPTSKQIFFSCQSNQNFKTEQNIDEVQNSWEQSVSSVSIMNDCPNIIGDTLGLISNIAMGNQQNSVNVRSLKIVLQDKLQKKLFVATYTIVQDKRQIEHISLRLKQPTQKVKGEKYFKFKIKQQNLVEKYIGHLQQKLHQLTSLLIRSINQKQRIEPFTAIKRIQRLLKMQQVCIPGLFMKDSQNYLFRSGKVYFQIKVWQYFKQRYIVFVIKRKFGKNRWQEQKGQFATDKSSRKYFFFSSTNKLQLIKNRVIQQNVGIKYFHSFFSISNCKTRIPVYIIKGVKDFYILINLINGKIQNVKKQSRKEIQFLSKKQTIFCQQQQFGKIKNKKQINHKKTILVQLIQKIYDKPSGFLKNFNQQQYHYFLAPQNLKRVYNRHSFLKRLIYNSQ